MSRTLTPDSSLENLRKVAKRWLRALRDGDARAQGRLLAITPAAAPTDPGCTTFSSRWRVNSGSRVGRRFAKRSTTLRWSGARTPNASI
jgi:hypothetical protein